MMPNTTNENLPSSAILLPPTDDPDADIEQEITTTSFDLHSGSRGSSGSFSITGTEVDAERSSTLPISRVDQEATNSLSADGVKETGIKLTGYRLLNIGVIFIFGTAKVILSCFGETIVPNALEWVLGVLFTLWLALFR